jgi:hypothetical protein
MPDPLPTWAPQVDSIMRQAGVPTWVWVTIAQKESGMNPTSEGDRTRAGVPTSFGLFQLHRGGQAPANVSDAQLKNPVLNAQISAPNLARGVRACPGGDITCIMINSGHPTETGSTAGLSPDQLSWLSEAKSLGTLLRTVPDLAGAWLLKGNTTPSNPGGSVDPDPETLPGGINVDPSIDITGPGGAHFQIPNPIAGIAQAVGGQAPNILFGTIGVVLILIGLVGLALASLASPAGQAATTAAVAGATGGIGGAARAVGARTVAGRTASQARKAAAPRKPPKAQNTTLETP